MRKLNKKNKELLIQGKLKTPFGINLLEQLNDEEFKQALSNFLKIPFRLINMKVDKNWCIRFLSGSHLILSVFNSEALLLFVCEVRILSVQWLSRRFPEGR